MKKLIIIAFLFTACQQKTSIDNEKIYSVVKEYYSANSDGIKSVDNISIDSIVVITEKLEMIEDLKTAEKRHQKFVDANDIEYTKKSLTAIEKIKQEIPKAENSKPLYYKVYHTIKFTGKNIVQLKRNAAFDVSIDYHIKPNVTTAMDDISGIKAN